MLFARLIVMTGERAGKAVVMRENAKVGLGRADSNTISLEDPQVSGKHCQIVGRGSEFVVEDLHSSNGTFLNGARLEEGPRILSDLDEVRAGGTTLRVRLYDTLEAAKAGVQAPGQRAEPPAERELGRTSIDPVPPSPMGQESQLNRVVRSERERETRVRTKEDRLISVAQQRGLISVEQAKHARLLQQQGREAGLQLSMPDILIHKGYLSRADWQLLLRQQAAGETPPRIEGYADFQLIGMGGMGAVYKAHHQAMDRPVAVKALSQHLLNNEQSRERFLQEARSVAKLNHENVVTGFECGEAEGRPYLIMEFVEGRTLLEELQDRRRLEEAEAGRIVQEVLRALAHANARGMIHRDIKPDNILLNEQRTVKVCDFGLACEMGESDGPGRKEGTPNYMSPEHVRGSRLDTRSDIYSLGITFYQLLFGRLPILGKTVKETLRMHLEQPVVFPSEQLTPLVRDLGIIIFTMTAKDPADRYATPQAAEAAIERTLEKHRSSSVSELEQTPSMGHPAAPAPQGRAPTRRPSVRRRRRRRRC